MQIWIYNPDQKIAPVIYCREGERYSQFKLYKHEFKRDRWSNFGWLDLEISLPSQQVFSDRDGEIRTMGVTLRGVENKTLTDGMYRFRLRLYAEIDASQTTIQYKVF